MRSLRGQGLVEYALIVALVVVVGVTTFLFVGEHLVAFFTTLVSRLP